MSQLQKKIERIQRQEGPGIGFARITREKPRAMLLAAIAETAAEAQSALAGGADFVIVRAEDAASAASTVTDSVGEGACIGVLVESLDEAGAAALAKAGCDFAIAALESTAAAAVDTAVMGHVVDLPVAAADELILRGLAPLGLDALYVSNVPGSLTLAARLDYVRAASMTGTPLIVGVGGSPAVADLRVLRDSGVAAVVVPAGTPLAAIDEALRAVPAPAKARRSGRDLAIVPASGGHGHDEHDDEGDEADE
ncbi:MAG: hypothetical protein ACSLFM_06645 [Tepidiformaceae bacterium]